jgi:uncharacterized membrane protein YkoI
MKKISWFWVTIGLLIAVSLFTLWLQFGKLSPTTDMLTKNDAEKLIHERYQGTVTKVKFTAQQYQIEMQKQNKLYLIKMDAASGKVLSFTLTSPPTESPAKTPVNELSEDEIKTIILNEVRGSIASIKRMENNQEPIYLAIINQANKQTTITVDAISGKILSTKSDVINDPPKTLTQQEAGKIALKQIQGTIDDILLETKNEETYFLVEIETQDDRGEAIVQIHAITGKVLSITWDDQDKEDDD